MEHIVAVQIRFYSNDLGNTFQSAYKTENWRINRNYPVVYSESDHLSLSKSMLMALVLLALSSAFDTIDHETLLSCLSTRFDFTGTVLSKIGKTFEPFHCHYWDESIPCPMTAIKKLQSHSNQPLLWFPRYHGLILLTDSIARRRLSRPPSSGAT